MRRPSAHIRWRLRRNRQGLGSSLENRRPWARHLPSSRHISWPSSLWRSPLPCACCSIPSSANAPLLVLFVPAVLVGGPWGGLGPGLFATGAEPRRGHSCLSAAFMASELRASSTPRRLPSSASASPGSASGCAETRQRRRADRTATSGPARRTCSRSSTPSPTP